MYLIDVIVIGNIQTQILHILQFHLNEILKLAEQNIMCMSQEFKGQHVEASH